jgi:hypothetical protein
MNNVTEKSFAFVIMPFAAPFAAAYQQIIKPAVEYCGIACVRADEEFQGHIHSQMLGRIYQSSVVIADITGLNANVFYELGVAHSSGYKTIVVCDQDALDKVPFDIAPYRVFSYPNPERHDRQDIERAVVALASEITVVIDNQLDGISNPVQDYLASQSPVKSSNSLFVNELDAKDEENLLVAVTRELVYYGITANSFIDLLTGLLETHPKSTQFAVQLCLLNPEAYDCWDFLYRMRDGKHLDPSQIEKFIEEDVSIQKRAIRRLESLSQRVRGFSVETHLYSIPPMFWAYMVDQERLIVGHLAMNRMSSRNLPVNILVRSDHSTWNLFAYYQSILESAMGRTETH